MGESVKTDKSASVSCVAGKMIAKTTFALCNPTANNRDGAHLSQKPLIFKEFLAAGLSMSLLRA
jgi:hypothetical protein